MKFHIVQVNEKISDISNKYNVSVEEIVKLNRHINNLDHIVPGMKIRLPILSDEVSDQLKDNFLDVEKYYPKLEEFKEVKVEKKEPDLYTNQENFNDEDDVAVPQQPYPQYPNYYPQQPYYYTQYQQPQYQQQQPYQQPIYPQQMVPQYQPYRVEPQSPQQPSVGVEKPIEKVLNSNEALFNQPAFCDPSLLSGGITTPKNNQEDHSIYQPYMNFFQNPLFTPPYPCSQPINEIDAVNFNVTDLPCGSGPVMEFDEHVKAINVDLRDFVKKHTKIHKKGESVDSIED